MKFFRRSKGWIIFYVFIVIVILKFLVKHEKFNISSSGLNPESSAIDSCPIPFYSFDNDKLINAFSKSNVSCSNSPNLVSIRDGEIIIARNEDCSYQCISWNTDFDYKLDDLKMLSNLQKVPCQYFIAFCTNNVTNFKDSQLIMAGIKHESVGKYSKEILNGSIKNRDVLIIGVDSLSYLAYQKYLPKTFSVLHNELKSVSFKKFNTLGDGTTANLQGFLTGTKDTETYESRRRIDGAKTVDGYNWIWNQYKKKGYLTQYYEEMTDYGTFQYRLLGFEKQPTDIYLRTLLMYAERNKFSKNFCFGNRLQHSEILRFYKETLESNKEVPIFSFIFYSYVSHDDNKYASLLDEDVSQFLNEYRKSNPNTFIVLYSDHGHRFNSRLSMKGKYEERLPFLGISLPNDMQHLKSTLESNSEVLVSGLDLHATLEDIIGIYKPQVRSRHMSLLRPLPRDRSCKDIESAAHWCACLSWRQIKQPNADRQFITVAADVVSQISNFTNDYRDVCSTLKFDKILSFYKLDANNEVLKFKQSADTDGLVPDLSDKTQQSDLWFRIVIRMQPANAEFEVTVFVKVELSNKFNMRVERLLPNDVSRINQYAPWIKCLHQYRPKKSLFPDVRKFCICKDAL